jgi:hypothetical protein
MHPPLSQHEAGRECGYLGCDAPVIEVPRDLAAVVSAVESGVDMSGCVEGQEIIGTRMVGAGGARRQTAHAKGPTHATPVARRQIAMCDTWPIVTNVEAIGADAISRRLLGVRRGRPLRECKRGDVLHGALLVSGT